MKTLKTLLLVFMLQLFVFNAFSQCLINAALNQTVTCNRTVSSLSNLVDGEITDPNNEVRFNTTSTSDYIIITFKNSISLSKTSKTIVIYDGPETSLNSASFYYTTDGSNYLQLAGTSTKVGNYLKFLSTNTVSNVKAIKITNMSYNANHNDLKLLETEVWGNVLYANSLNDLKISGIATFDYRVGIGTCFPTSPLTVNGKIECEEVEVKNIAADYVFYNDYKLLPINELESYIKENKHLPEIPAAEYTAKGVNLGEFNKLLLQKIEELSLYIIEQNKRIETLEKANQK